MVCHFRCRRLRGVPAPDNMSPAATPTITSTARITRTNFTGRDYQNHVAEMSCSEAVALFVVTNYLPLAFSGYHK